MTKITVTYQLVRNLLDDTELRKFNKLLADPAPEVKAFLDALDRPDVALGMMFTPAFGVPGIVPACIALKGNKAFEAAVAGNDYLKKCLGAVTKARAMSLGLAPTGRKGRMASWMPGFTVAEVYQATPNIGSVLSFDPRPRKGPNAFDAAVQL
ncbi:MAG: hypothetical protein LV481_01325 [Methylacidiphilales bacterium]|nr:hypothetical protein [Candidatus Methylacidiphilales bacterium]